MIKCFEMTPQKAQELTKDTYIDHDELMAYTLRPSVFKKAKEHGWIFHAEVHEDYYEWINEFCAIRLSDHAAVWGDFEDKVFASSQEAFDEFSKLFQPDLWDYGDI